jgi:transposase
VTVLAAAPTPTAALTQTQLRELLHSARRNAPRLPSNVARDIRPQWRPPAQVEAAMGRAVIAIVRTLSAALDAIKALETALDATFAHHPDAEILRSLPGLGLILGARVLGEFGDDPTRFADAASRRAYAGSAPVTRVSGKTTVILLRRACNRRLANGLPLVGI